MNTKRLPIRCLIVLVCLSSTVLCSEIVEQEARVTYNNLVEQFINGKANEIDLRAMRVAAAEGRIENEFVARVAQKKINEALKANDFQLALRLAREAVDRNFVNMEAHFDMSLAYKGLGNDVFSKVEEHVFRNFVASILSSGDGKSAKTAFFVVYQREEYVVARVLNLRPTAQSLVTKDGHYYDVLKTTDKDGNSRDLWFDADTILRLESPQ